MAVLPTRIRGTRRARARALVFVGTVFAASLHGCGGFDPPQKAKRAANAGACAAPPGEFPPAQCNSSRNQCTELGCPIAEACGTDSACLAFAKNASSEKLQFRLRSLYVATPEILSRDFVQINVVTKNIDLKQTQCAELGTGSFNWLLEFDLTKNILRTGGAPPVNNPISDGYCFYYGAPNGFAGGAIGPSTFETTREGNRFSTNTVEKFFVPIFINGNTKNVIVLPISDARFSEIHVSDDSRCIGSFNARGIQSSNCVEDRERCQKWNTAGTIGGYVTLEDADSVFVELLDSSLCAVLTRDRGNDNRCRRENGKIAALGDYCSTTKSEGGCQDSYWLAATFAASAVRIHDGAKVKDCQAPKKP